MSKDLLIAKRTAAYTLKIVAIIYIFLLTLIGMAYGFGLKETLSITYEDVSTMACVLFGGVLGFIVGGLGSIMLFYLAEFGENMALLTNAVLAKVETSGEED